MSSITSLECSIKFDNSKSAEEQLKIFQNIPDDRHDCMGTWIDCFEFGEALCDDKDKYVEIFVQVKGEPQPHDIINYFWKWIKHPECVENMNISVENLERGSYGILSASDSSQFTERWIPTGEVFDVIRRNPDDLGSIYSTLNDLLESSK